MEQTWKNRGQASGRLECPGCAESFSTNSHQADPCVYCGYALHDRCFYTRRHGCVQDGLIAEDATYAQIKAA